MAAVVPPGVAGSCSCSCSCSRPSSTRTCPHTPFTASRHRLRNPSGPLTCGSSSHTCHLSSSSTTSSSRALTCCSSSEQRDQGAPWALTFDLRERETEWTDANKARLVSIIAAQRLGLPPEQVEADLDTLANLLPDIGTNISHLHPDIVTDLLRLLPQLPGRLLALKDIFPAANVSALVTAAPRLLLQEPEEVAAAAAALRELLGRDDIDKLVESEPLFLSTDCVTEVLSDMSRLLPPGSDTRALLVADPTWLLRVQRGQRWLGLPADWLPGEQIP